MITRRGFVGSTLGAVAMSRSELQSVQRISDELLKLADASQSPPIAIAGHVRLGILTFHQGRLDAARDSLSRALELCGAGDRDLPDFAITSSPDVAAAAYLANTLAHLGYIYAQPYKQYSELRFQPLADAGVAVHMADWYQLTFAQQAGALKVTRIDYLMREGH